MNILFDTRWLKPNPTGVGWYIQELAQELHQKQKNQEFDKKLANQDKIELTFLGGDMGKLPAEPKKIKLPLMKKKVYQWLWKTFEWPPLNSLAGKQDLVHFTNGTAVPHHYDKNIITVHDLTFMEFPEMIEPKNLHFLQKKASWSLKQASHIIAVSQDTKKDLQKHFQIPEEKISVIYNGVDRLFLQKPTDEELENVRKKYQLTSKFFLSVSTIEPRKDFGTLIEAYNLLPAAIKNEYQLLIVGGKGWQNEYKKITDLIHKLKLKEKVKLLGYIDYKDLPIIYRLAQIYIHTSLKEGFGIGLIQAMASHLPIIASNISCHPEIVKNAGIYFEPQNPQDLQKKIIEMLNKKGNRQYYVTMGSKIIENYSWKKAAEETLTLYQKVLTNS